MASFNVRDAENYGGQGGGGFLSLKNNKDTAQVRILYESIDDVDGKSVHEVTLNGKKRYVNCLRNYGDPVDACPLCKAGSFVQVKYFVPLYVMAIKTNNEHPDRVAPIVTPVNAVMTWERGKKYGNKLSSVCSRYTNPISHVFEIERNGVAGDSHTEYEIWETGDATDGARVEDFDVPNPLGTIILDKTAEEMETFLQTGDFGGQAPVRRDSTSSYNNAPQNNAPAQGGFTRRTPANGNRPF